MKETEEASKSDRSLPKAKQTSLGLYLTAKQAFEKWQANPELVKILDVRTPEEIIFVGHPEMAWNVALALQTYQWDSTGKGLSMKPNPEFLTQVGEVFKPSDTLLVMCRSGGRSAKAIDLLAEAGFSDVYNIIDGMEGDVVDDPDSAYHGKRLKNGWKNSGLPWTYSLDPERICLPTIQAEPRLTTAGETGRAS